MADETESPAPPDAEALARCAAQVAEAASADLSAALGRGAELKPAGVESISAEKVATDDKPIVHQLCRATGALAGEVHALIPRPEAAQLALLQQGSEEEVSKEPLDAEMLAALSVTVKLIVDALANALGEEGFETSIDLRDAREIPEPMSDPTWLAGDHFHRLRFDLVVERVPAGRVDLLLAREVDAATTGGPGTTILFIVSREAEQEPLEELTASLGWPVSVACAEALDDAPLDSAGAIVVPWNIGGRSGLELVESLASRSEAPKGAFVMAARAPTRAMVLAALRAGATGFTHLPYAGDELRRQILSARGEASQPQGLAEPNAAAAPPAAETDDE